MAFRHGTLPHAADLGLWVWASSLEELYAGAVTAMAALMVQGPRGPASQEVPLELVAPDRAALLVELLNEVVYRLDAEGLLALGLEVREQGPTRLAGRLSLTPLDRERQAFGEAVKAVTYHQASVLPEGDGWRGQVILDV